MTHHQSEHCFCKRKHETWTDTILFSKNNTGRPVYIYVFLSTPAHILFFVWKKTKKHTHHQSEHFFRKKTWHLNGHYFVFEKKYRAANIHICFSLTNITGTDTCVFLFISKIETQRGWCVSNLTCAAGIGAIGSMFSH